MISFQNGYWTTSNREATWHAFGPRIYDEDLDAFRKLASSILSEPDPQFELSKEERWSALVYGKSPRHSQLLRKGVTETIALLGNQPSALTHCTHGKAENTALLIVRDILHDADWIRWASLNGLLPILAEASPREFIASVERALTKSPCPFDDLFAQEGDGISGANHITGLLWALETLAWEEEFLPRVTVLLGQLAARDPGGKWANRPENSLVDIFLPWYPQTLASFQKQQAALTALENELPQVAWQLLVNLLPDQRMSSSGTRQPEWRKSVPDEWESNVSTEDYWAHVDAIASSILSAADLNPVKLAEIARMLISMPEAHIEQFLTRIGSKQITSLPEGERFLIWSEMAKIVAKCRRHPDSDWAIEGKVLDRIESVSKAIAPSDPGTKYRPLFSEYDHDLFSGDEDRNSQRIELAKRRRTAINEIYASGGIETVIDFAKAVGFPEQVGASLAETMDTDLDSAILPRMLSDLDPKLMKFIGGYVWARFRKGGFDWLDKTYTASWTPAQLGRFFSYMPFTNEVWERVAIHLGIEQGEYWKIVPVNVFQIKGDVIPAVDKLLEFDRPITAIECLERMLDEQKKVDHPRTFRALQLAASVGETRRSLDIFTAVKLIKELQNESIDEQQLAKTEWLYLNALDKYHGASPKTLEQALAKSPSLFCDVIQKIFRSTKEEPSETEISKEQADLAAQAYRLLEKWKTIPGTNSVGALNPTEFESWMSAVKNQATESGHLEVALSRIGHVLIYAPPDDDGLWIDKTVAAELNSLDTEELRRGYYIGVINSRGAHHVDPTGAPEKELARKYRERANSVEDRGFQRFAAILRDLAASYERDAERIIAENRSFESLG
jgi:hypothetical protein